MNMNISYLPEKDTRGRRRDRLAVSGEFLERVEGFLDNFSLRLRVNRYEQKIEHQEDTGAAVYLGRMPLRFRDAPATDNPDMWVVFRSVPGQGEHAFLCQGNQGVVCLDELHWFPAARTAPERVATPVSYPTVVGIGHRALSEAA